MAKKGGGGVTFSLSSWVFCFEFSKKTDWVIVSVLSISCHPPNDVAILTSLVNTRVGSEVLHIAFRILALSLLTVGRMIAMTPILIWDSSDLIPGSHQAPSFPQQ